MSGRRVEVLVALRGERRNGRRAPRLRQLTRGVRLRLGSGGVRSAKGEGTLR